MTTAQKQSAINRFNDRLVQIGKAFGVDSYQYQQYLSKLELLVGIENINTKTDPKTKKIISNRAKRGKSVVDQISDEDIKAMDQQSTAGEIKKRIREDLAEEEGISPKDVTPEMIKRRAQEIGEVRARMDEIGSALSDALHNWREAHNQHGKLTYTQINEALEEFDGTRHNRQEDAKRQYDKHFGDNEAVPFETAKVETPKVTEAKGKGFRAI